VLFAQELDYRICNIRLIALEAQSANQCEVSPEYLLNLLTSIDANSACLLLLDTKMLDEGGEVRLLAANIYIA